MAGLQQTTNTDTTATSYTDGSQGSQAEFESTLLAQANIPPPSNSAPATSGSSDPTLNLPPQDEENLTNLIMQSLRGVPAGTAPIIGTRIVALPPDVVSAFPPEVRRMLPADASASMALILPPDTLSRLQTKGAGDVLMNSTLWLGVVPPSGTGPAGSAYVMTIKMNGNPFETGQSPTVDFRAGWAFLNDVRPQNVLRGQSPIVPDRADPDTWLFVNAGITGDISRIQDIPSAFEQGFRQLDQSITYTKNANGQTTGVSVEIEGGGVVTAGALFRVPGSERLAHRAGESLINIGRSVAAAPTPVTTPIGGFIGALGVVLRQSNGVYVGPGGSLSRLTLDSSGEMQFGFPGSSYSANIADTPAAGANIGSDLVRGLDPNWSTSIDNSANPTRQTLTDIVNTPTNNVGGQPESNDLRLGLYWDELLENSPNLDLVNVGSALVQGYNRSDASASQKENISNLYHRPEMEPVRILFSNMFDVPNSEQIYMIGGGTDGRATVQDLGREFNNMREQLGAREYTQRLQRTARALYDAGWDVNFGIPDLANAINAVERGTGRQTQRDPLYNEVAPLLRP